MTATNPTGKTVTIVNGDTTIVRVSGDTAIVNAAEEAAAAVGETVNEALNDTVYDGNYEGVTEDEVQFMHEGMRTARNITLGIIAGAIFITFLALLFYYLNRRRKYKMIEKAIENGYPLPPEMLGGHTVQQHNIYVTPPTQPQPQMPQQPQQQASGAIPVGVPQRIPVGQPLSQWQTYRGGIITTIVGFSLMLFFLAAGATPMVALMSIILFIGLAKVFFTYQEQRNITNIYTNATQQPQPQQPQQQPQQPAQPQRPVQPTPPPFRQEEAKPQSQPEAQQSTEQPS